MALRRSRVVTQRAGGEERDWGDARWTMLPLGEPRWAAEME